MTSPLKPIAETSSIPTQVLRGLVSSIVSGELKVGQSLPSESEIATQMGVGISSVREALATLQGMGVVAVRHGAGRVLRGLTFSVLTDPRLSDSLMNGGMALDVWHVRLALEIACIRLATENASEADLEAISAAAEAMAVAVARGDLGAEEDGEFHRTIAQATGNIVFLWLHDALAPLTLRSRIRGLGHEGRQQTAISEHQDLAAALRARDVEKAEQRLRAHLQWGYADALEILRDEQKQSRR